MSQPKRRLMRVATVPLSLKMFCKELLGELTDSYDVLAVSSPGKELDELDGAGIPTAEVPMARNISLSTDIRSLWQLIRLMRRWRPDIVHSMTPKAGLLCMMAAWITRVPVRIHSFTGLLFPTATGLKRIILKTTDRITCACATHILPEGQGVKADLINGHITSKDMQVLGNGNLRGIDLEHYAVNDDIALRTSEIRRNFSIPDDHFVFIFVGRIVTDKGLSELANAFARLVKEYPQAHLLLVGAEEPAEDPLPETTRSVLSSTPHVHCTGGWADDVRPYYAAADALVFPSYREGFPNVVIEAGAMGLPSIVTDINGSREIVISGTNGDIIPAHDADVLYQAMRRYISDPEYVSRLRSNARKLIESRYEASYVRGCIKAFYRGLYPD